MTCEIELQAGTAVCKTHGKTLVCPSAIASRGNKAMRRRHSKAERLRWAKKGGKLGGRPKGGKKNAVVEKSSGDATTP